VYYPQLDGHIPACEHRSHHIGLRRIAALHADSQDRLDAIASRLERDKTSSTTQRKDRTLPVNLRRWSLMLFHASIPAHHPENVARVIAELWGGFHAPFPAFPDSWMAVAGDDRGSIIETYPSDRVIFPGSGQNSCTVGPSTTAQYTAFHLAIASKLTPEQVLAIGEREGWRAVRCTRGQNAFDVIELWIDNVIMIEVLTEEMQKQYLAFATPENFRAFAASAAAQA
jgi:hypothetical protein